MFSVTVKDLRDLIEAEKSEGVAMLRSRYNGPKGLCDALKTDPKNGISSSEAEIASRIASFGENVMPTKAPTTLLELIWEALQDFTLIMLLASAAVSIALGIYEDITHGVKGWVEGVAILFSVFIVVSVSALNDYAKEKQFRKLNAQAADVAINVIRDGKQQTVSIFKLLVGDIVEIAVGDILPADGVLIQGNDLRIDESSLTGESDMIKKSEDTPFLLSNTKAMEGSGKMLVIAVGQNSQAGIIKYLILTGQFSTSVKKPENADAPQSEGTQLLSEDERGSSSSKDEEDELAGSVLQAKLEDLAVLIGKIGTVVAVLAVTIMIIRVVAEEHDSWGSDQWNDIIRFFITGITILVVAVPEGLPLAVTLSLAFSVQKMLDDNNLVKHLDACETMGSATTICSDKTGTLTTNRMTVMASWIGDQNVESKPTLRNVNKSYADTFAKSIAVNSTGRVEKDEKGLWEYIGNKTECGMLKFLIEEGYNITRLREEAEVVQVFPFSSKRKRMSTVVRQSGSQLVLYTKGASEIILDLCTHYMDLQGNKVPLSKEKIKTVLVDTIERFAREGLRTLCIAYREVSSADLELRDSENEPLAERDLVCLGILGIEDPVRDEVPHSIEVCRRAGITVRMVTGDNLTTAISIARKCGILSREAESYENQAMEGPDFRRKVLREDGTINQAVFDGIWPQLRVLARSSPADKFTLVTGLLQSDLYPDRQVVAVTGDGTNDAPALKKADVGFAMGIQGTSVAKDACDIILLDDNFTSIVKAVKWGRNVYDSIGKFLQFQLTVNVVAITVAFVGSVIREESPLKAVQLLWVNLIMDSFASLALATEPPTDDLLNRKPYGRNQSLISARMGTMIVGSSFYQIIIIFVILFAPEAFGFESGWGYTDPGDAPTEHFTVVFNTFVLMQLFNEFNARNLHGEWNPFRNIQNNHIFTGIWIGTFLVQVFIVFVGGQVFGCKPISSADWGICLGFGIGNLFWGMMLQIVPDTWIASVIPLRLDEPHEPETGSKSANARSHRRLIRGNSRSQRDLGYFQRDGISSALPSTAQGYKRQTNDD
eukprot:TRINITY_DN1196_c0_g1_i1.p1 TRINITY_DN1196_c0_g1~~TRINITY_DN1196_c0_g1_i1.p1  ORF type:complete len:1056 (+),score=254.28 TRINITY_DN1196_c0_g1_i1:49-3216(+)